MAIDDTDDKVRRNLVVYSSLVLATWWLGGPDLSPISNLMNITTPNPPKWKLMVLAILIHVYLIARYWFSTTHVDARKIMHKDWAEIFMRTRDDFIDNSLLSYHKTRKQPLFLETNLASCLKDYERLANRKIAEGDILEITSITKTWTSLTRGTATAKCRIFNSTHPRSSEHNAFLGIKIPIKVQYSLKLQTAIKQLSYSKSSVEYFIPLVLATGAAVVLTFKMLY